MFSRLTRTASRWRAATAVLALVVLFVLPAAALAQQSCFNSKSKEVPCLSVEIPTVKFTKVYETKEGPTSTLHIPFIAQYINGVYQFGVYLGTTLAAVMIMVGGFQYLTAGGDAGRVGKAQARIQDAIVALLLVLGAYALLVTVNPDLGTLSTLEIKTIAAESLSGEDREDHGDTEVAAGDAARANGEEKTPGAPGKPGSGAVCGTPEDCKKICDLPETQWPKSSAKTVSEDMTVTIPVINGLDGNHQKTTPKTLAKLVIAAEKAYKDKKKIVVASGWRSMRKQMLLVCGRIKSGKPDEIAGIGHAVAWPGGSNHGSGVALDLQLFDLEKNKVIVNTEGGCKAQARGGLGENSDVETLAKIMFDAGFVRYAKEIWHFESQAGAECRCTAVSTFGSGTRCPSYPTKCNGGCTN